MAFCRDITKKNFYHEDKYTEKSRIRDFRGFALGIFSRFFRGFKISIPIPGISGFSGFFNLAQNKKSRSWIPGIGIRDPEKIPTRSQLWSLWLIFLYKTWNYSKKNRGFLFQSFCYRFWNVGFNFDDFSSFLRRVINTSISLHSYN